MMSQNVYINGNSTLDGRKLMAVDGGVRVLA